MAQDETGEEAKLRIQMSCKGCVTHCFISLLFWVIAVENELEPRDGVRRDY